MDRIRTHCMMFLNHSIGLVELQERLDTAIVPEHLHDIFWKLHNQLEEIRFTKLESNYYVHAEPIIRELLEKLPEFNDTN